MELSKQQVAEFEEQGYLFLPNRFNRAEVEVMRAELPGIFAQERPEVWREKDGKTVRTAFAAHTYNETFRRLAAHPRMVWPVMQLLGGEVYVHQFKINGKEAFDGEVWQWHQDYYSWAVDDLMPAPRAMNIAVYLDEVTEFNGPIMFIPKSHKWGPLDSEFDTETTSYPLWTPDRATIARLAEDGGIVAPKGPPGSVVLFHCNLLHGSPSNISPWGRVIVYVSLCHVENHIRRFKRPAFVAHRDFTPIAMLADDCLMVLSAQAAR